MMAFLYIFFKGRRRGGGKNKKKWRLCKHATCSCLPQLTSQFFFLFPLMKGLILRQNLSALPFRKCRVPIQPPVQPHVQPHVQPPFSPRSAATLSLGVASSGPLYRWRTRETLNPPPRDDFLGGAANPPPPSPPAPLTHYHPTSPLPLASIGECLLPADRREKGRVTEKVSPAARLQPPEGGCS